MTRCWHPNLERRGVTGLNRFALRTEYLCLDCKQPVWIDELLNPINIETREILDFDHIIRESEEEDLGS